MQENPPSVSDQLGVSSVITASSLSDEQIVNRARGLLGQEIFRARTNEIIREYADTVPFMKKVQGYADEQIDKRLFKNSKVVVGIVLGWIVTGVIAFLVAKWTK